MKKKDLSGQKIGHLIVTEMLYGIQKTENSRPRTYCRCVCDCGNETIIQADHLSRPNPSCAVCSRKRVANQQRTDERGNKYGRLTIVDIDRTKRPAIAICRCECGAIIRVAKSDVVCGHTQSCGCLRRERVTAANEKDYSGFVSKWGVKILSKADKNKHGTWL